LCFLGARNASGSRVGMDDTKARTGGRNALSSSRTAPPKSQKCEVGAPKIKVNGRVRPLGVYDDPRKGMGRNEIYEL
jgi:hypothetical protein